MERTLKGILLIAVLSSNIGYGQEDLYQYTNDNFRSAKVFNDTVDLSNPDPKILNAAIFYLTNETRLKNDKTELKYNPLLEKSATLHSDNMVKYNFFDHFNPRSKKLHDPNDRARFVGIYNPYLAENIAKGFVLDYISDSPVYPAGRGIFLKTPNGKPIRTRTYLEVAETLMDAWMHSPHHRANILSRNAVQLGCGTTIYILNDFNDMPAVMATQNFQLYEPIRSSE